MKKRTLHDLVSVGPQTVHNLKILGITTVEELALCNAQELYKAMCDYYPIKPCICLQDTFEAAIAQAKNPNLPAEQKTWFYWSSRRKENARKCHSKKLKSFPTNGRSL